jgi:hypothetical protein
MPRGKRWTTRTTGGGTGDKWSRETYDGLGRVAKVETGYGTGTGTVESVVETVYDACACSPMGKAK